jgi:hypothetical protein
MNKRYYTAFFTCGMHWQPRETYNIGLPKHLGIGKDSLSGRSDCYLQPGPEHGPDPQGGHSELTRKGHAASKAIRTDADLPDANGDFDLLRDPGSTRAT